MFIKNAVSKLVFKVLEFSYLNHINCKKNYVSCNKFDVLDFLWFDIFSFSEMLVIILFSMKCLRSFRLRLFFLHRASVLI